MYVISYVLYTHMLTHTRTGNIDIDVYILQSTGTKYYKYAHVKRIALGELAPGTVRDKTQGATGPVL